LISRAFIDYDTCPKKGFDSLRIKKTLNLQSSSKINIVLGYRIQEETSVNGDPILEFHF
jgi:hypothetical protein